MKRFDRNSSARKLHPRAGSIQFLQPLEPRRLLAVAGSLDPSFSDDGLATYKPDNTAWTAHAVAVQSDGKTVVAGTSGLDIAVARFNVDGTPDTTFGPTHNGSVFTHVGKGGEQCEGTAVAIQDDGKIVVAGNFDTGSSPCVIRYNAEGTLDKTFDSDGIRTIDFGLTALDALFNAIAIQSDGKIVVAGDRFGGLPINDDFGVVRLNPNGSLDGSFDGDGKATVDFGDEEQAYGVAIDYSGTPTTNPRYGGIVLVGTKHNTSGTFDTSTSFAIARLTKGGAKDNSFDGDGKATTVFPAQPFSTARAVTIQSDGQIVVAGTAAGTNSNIKGHDFALVRYMPNGALDTSFGPPGNGRIVVDLGGNDDAYGIAVSNADGKYLVGGGSDNKFAALKVGTDGQVDGSFGTNGHVITGVGGAVAEGIAAGPGRRFVLAGGGSFHTARYLEAGANLVHATAAFDPVANEAGQDKASFFVFREEKLPTPLRVYFSVGGEASAPRFGRIGGDYTADGIVFPIAVLGGGDDRPYVDIPANQTVATVTITPRDDTLAEGVEHAVFTITPDAAYEVGAPNVATLNIFDNDGGSISGTAFVDKNMNGVLDIARGEGGISGVTIFADADNDKVLDPTERVTTTDASGNYTLANLPAASYVVRQILPSGYTQFFPASNFGIHLTLAQDQNLTGQNFADLHVLPSGSIAGTVYNDLDGDGMKDALETGIAGRTVFIDANNNSVLDSTEKKATTDANGAYKFTGLAASLYNVREVRPTGWSQTSPAGNAGLTVILIPGQNATGWNFFIRPTPGGTASIAGNVFHDFNRNARKDTGDTNQSAWVVYIDLDNDKVLDTNEQRVITDSAGNYRFANLAAGTYKIRVVLKTGYVQTLPTGGFGNNATLAAGQKATGKNFGVDN